ncbi:MAG: hypothetical protein R3A80_01825 [Bdellovibrionota bacterium]
MIAVVDIGSNSVKVLVAKMQHGVMQEIHLDAETTSLARGLPQTGELSHNSMLATLSALKRFKQKLDQLGVKDVKVIGTAAMREASNAQHFAQEINVIFPSPIEIISGSKEAEISLVGAMTARPENISEESCLFADLGGASTEIGFSKPHILHTSTSLGALKTHNALNLGSEAINDNDWKKAQDYIHSILEKEISPELKNKCANRKHLIAVGGTIVMATAALGLKPFKEGCYHFERNDLENFAEKLRKLDEAKRLEIPNIMRDRADILPFGIMLLTQIMSYLGQKDGISTVRGLRHGLATNFFADNK